jgi:hypothetical protein
MCTKWLWDAYGDRSVNRLLEKSSPGSAAITAGIIRATVHAFMMGDIVDIDNKFRSHVITISNRASTYTYIYASWPLSLRRWEKINWRRGGRVSKIHDEAL